MAARVHKRRMRASPLLFVGRLLLALFKLALLGALLAAVLGYAAFAYYGRNLPDPTTLGAVPAAEGTRILARDGTLLYEIADPELGRRNVVPLDRIPLALRQATVAVEDASFYENPGVDLRGIVRALYLNYREGEIVSGGSTITQQLVRGVLLSPEERKSQSFERKLREAILAYRVGREYSKDTILQLYLNRVYYGNQAYGVEAAAQAYFGKHVWELSLPEITMIAGLPQSPTRLNPLEYPEAARARQEVTLAQMVKEGYLSAAEADAVRATPLSYKQPETNIRAPHFAFFVRQLLEERYGPEMVYRGGLVVTTTLDLSIQAQAERIALERINELRPRNAHNAAAVVLSPQGEILAMVGSVDYYQPAIDGKVNVTLAPRQPGSALKPVVYAAAMQRGWTPATVIWDVPSEFAAPGGGTYAPNNYDRAFHGPQRLRMALANSLNIPAVKALEFVGLDGFLELAHQMGITTLNDRPNYGLSLALGAGEVRLLDLAAVYATLRNGGHRTPPVALLEVRTTRGDAKFVQRFDDGHGRPLLGPQVLGPQGEQLAYLLTDMLSDTEARRYMFGSDNVMELPDGRPVAAKTGTTDHFHDSWALGYTPDVVVGVWVGNTDNAPMEEIAGSNGAGLIWRDLMVLLHEGKEPRPFERPQGIVDTPICADTGGLAAPGCSATVDERFVAGSEPRTPNVTERPVLVGGDGSCLAGPATPPEEVREVRFPVYPPEFRDWALERGIPQPPTVVCAPPDPLTLPGAVAIRSPGDGALVGTQVAVNGVARGQYVLEVGPGRDPQSWQTLAEGAAADGILGYWQAVGQPPGEYTIRLRLTNGVSSAVVVQLDATPPVVALRAPSAGQSVAAGQAVALQAAASDDSGAVTVEFYVDGALLGTAGAPYELVWTPTPGVHTLSVAAVDAAGNRANGGNVVVVAR